MEPLDSRQHLLDPGLPVTRGHVLRSVAHQSPHEFLADPRLPQARPVGVSETVGAAAEAQTVKHRVYGLRADLEERPGPADLTNSRANAPRGKGLTVPIRCEVLFYFQPTDRLRALLNQRGLRRSIPCNKLGLPVDSTCRGPLKL